VVEFGACCCGAATVSEVLQGFGDIGVTFPDDIMKSTPKHLCKLCRDHLDKTHPASLVLELIKREGTLHGGECCCRYDCD
jgi:hypothetical protein